MKVFPSNVLENAMYLRRLIIAGCAPGSGETSRLQTIERGAFSNCGALERLDLRGNRIISIPEKLPVSIRHLNLAFNQLRNLQTTCVPPEHLTYGAPTDQRNPNTPTGPRRHESGSLLRSLQNLQENVLL